MRAAARTSSIKRRLGCDRDGEDFVLSIDIEGQIPILRYGNLRRAMILKPFHPLDISLRIGSLALAPDSQVVAVRIDTRAGLGLPLLCDLGSEQVRLIAPDPQARIDWIATLLGTSRTLLAAALPQAEVEGRKVDRATLLPIAGEIADPSPFHVRLRRLGTIGIALLDRPAGASSSPPGGEPTIEESEDELRFFFDYLRDNDTAAEADLELLESRPTTPDVRLKLLGLRAQLIASSGQPERAEPIVDYLIKTQGAEPRLVEETPAGLTFSRVDDPARAWPHYLKKMLDRKAHQGSAQADEPGNRVEELEQRLPRRFGGAFGGQGPAGGNPPFFRMGEMPEGVFPRPMGGPFNPVPRPRLFPPQPLRPVPPPPRPLRREIRPR